MRDVLEKLTARAWPVWIVLGVGACFLYVAIPSAGGGSLLSAATGLVSVGLSLYGIRRHRSASVLAWLIFVGGQVAWVLGDLAYAVNAFALHQQPYPSVADLLYLVLIRSWSPGCSCSPGRTGLGMRRN